MSFDRIGNKQLNGKNKPSRMYNITESSDPSRFSGHVFIISRIRAYGVLWERIYFVVVHTIFVVFGSSFGKYNI